MDDQCSTNLTPHGPIRILVTGAAGIIGFGATQSSRYWRRLWARGQTESLSQSAGDVTATYADVESLEQATGFTPRTPMRERNRRFVAWYKDFYRL